MVVYRNKSSYKKSRITLKKKRQWGAREKLLIVHYAEQCGSNRLAAKKFEVEPKQIRYWKNQKNQLENAIPYIQKLHKGREAYLPELEKNLSLWVTDMRQAAKAITRNMVIRRTKSITKDYLNLYPNINNFKFSNAWLEGFMKRFNFAIHRQTHIAQHLPNDLLQKQQSFLSFILYRRI